MKNSYRIIDDIPTYHENCGRLQTCQTIRNYIEGGNGVVTLHSPSGVYKTYSFRKPKEDIFRDDPFFSDTLFVYVLVSSGCWMYVGMYQRNKLKLTQASRYGIEHPIVKGAKYIVRMMNDPRAAKGPMILYHEGVCSVCGRRLTHPKSIQIGVGPSCRKRG